MNTLKDIPLKDYDNTKLVYNFLNENKTIGNENAEYNGIWHVHWRGSIDNNKVILQLKSILATQYVTKIYFWIENESVTKDSPFYQNLIQFKDYIEIKLFDSSVIMQASGRKGVNKWLIHYYNQQVDRRYKSDIFRFVILNIYGGMYTDLDCLMLRDVRNLKINNWSSKWGVEPYAECCILKLEKGSDAYEQMFLNDPRNAQCFLNIQNNLPEAFNYKYDNLSITSLPSTFFDIVWNEWENNELDFLDFNTFPKFFEGTDKEVSMNSLFKGCFSYHWHNNWDKPELKNSFAGKINADIDRIIEEKYNITPHKIFYE